MSDGLRVLLVEDSTTDATLILRELGRGGRRIVHERVERAEEMRAALSRASWDVIISDWSMPNFSADGALHIVKEFALDIPFIIVSGTMGEENAVDAMRSGAHDYVLKGRLSRLVPAVERELREFKMREAHRESERKLKESEEALRQSEGQLRHAQKMDAVGRLAGGVAHDFNNALSVILTYGELVLSSLPPDDPNREDVEEIRRAGQRAADLTRQLLMFSRQQVVAPEVMNLNEVLGGMRRLFDRILGEDVELALVTEPALWMVRVDPSSFDQVIMNLMVNARDALPEGGKLTIETRNTTIDQAFARTHLGAVAGDYAMVAVTDTGTGMDKATLARIFDPFFTTKEKGKGTGLGLSTVFGIVQQAGGGVWVESEPGTGSTFRVYFPRVAAAVTARRSSAPPLARGGSETILLVEDEEPVRNMLEMVLRRQGYTVLVASDGPSALIASARHMGPISLLLTDVVMPRMSGPELARQIVANRPGIVTLYVSGYTDDSVVRHGIAAGELAFLPKPITPNVLAIRVRELLDRRDDTGA
jgi:signal transduction histidine kinase